MSFDLLLNKLNEVADLSKALPADDKDEKNKGAGAGGESGEQTGNGGGGDDTQQGFIGEDELDDDDDGKGAGGESMSKSFALTLADGTEVEAFDGGDLIKSLTTRLETTEAALVTSEGQILKSLNAAVDLIGAQATRLNEQGDLIKSLQTKVSELSKTGRGRVSTLTVTEKPNTTQALNKSLPQQMGRGEILAKSLTAMQEKRITGMEASKIEAAVNGGFAVDPALLSKISS